jgi:drug/metabolite transporter (DMT)-like permease
MFYLYLLLVVFLSAVGVLGDFFLKLAGKGQKFVEVRWLILGAAIYALTAIGWFYVMKFIKLSSLGVIYAISTLLFVVLLGVYYFHERLNVYEIIAIVLALTSLVILSRFA